MCKRPTLKEDERTHCSIRFILYNLYECVLSYSCPKLWGTIGHQLIHRNFARGVMQVQPVLQKKKLGIKTDLPIHGLIQEEPRQGSL